MHLSATIENKWSNLPSAKEGRSSQNLSLGPHPLSEEGKFHRYTQRGCKFRKVWEYLGLGEAGRFLTEHFHDSSLMSPITISYHSALLMGINLSKLWTIVKYREAWDAIVHGVAKSQTRLSKWTATTALPKTVAIISLIRFLHSEWE